MLLAMTALCLPALASPADGSDPVKYDLKIDRQSLSTALQEFATQSGVQIIFFAKVTDGIEAPTLRGKYTAADAVARLLDHSDLTFQQLNSKTIEVQPKAATNDLKKTVGSSIVGRRTTATWLRRTPRSRRTQAGNPKAKLRTPKIAKIKVQPRYLLQKTKNLEVSKKSRSRAATCE